MHYTKYLVAGIVSLVAATPAPFDSNSEAAVKPSNLTFTYFFANAACSGPNTTQTLTPGKCTFVEFNDGQGAISYRPFKRGNDFPPTTRCYLQSWKAESCVGSPASSIAAEDASKYDCTPTLRGLSVKLVC